MAKQAHSAGCVEAPLQEAGKKAQLRVIVFMDVEDQSLSQVSVLHLETHTGLVHNVF
jgi:hypothetical protein